MTTPSTTLRPPLDDLFNQASADITLRTSDHVDLHVHTQILSQASPVFSMILSLPQPQACGQTAGAITSDRPVIDVSEDSKTLRSLLRLCYPVDKEVITDLDHIVLVYKAALKYEMDWPLRLLERDDLVGMAPRSPLQVWAIAARSGAEELARKACSEIRRGASLTPDTSGLDVLNTMLEEDKYNSLQGVRAGDYFRLREYLKDGDGSGHELLQPNYKNPSTYPKRPGSFVPHISSPDLYVHGRGSGDVKHCVHGAILAWHSSILADMVDAAKAAQSATSSISTGKLEDRTPAELQFPVLKLDVDPSTLHNLLDVCYSGVERLPRTVSHLAPLIVAAGKLGMTQVRALADVAWQTAASENALEAYFVALQHKLESYAATAARKVLEKPLERGWYTSAMESSPAMAYQRLLDYYQACARRVNEELCRVAEHCRTQVARKSVSVDDQERSVTASVYDRERITNYLQEVGRKTTTEGPVAGRDAELSLTALLRSTCPGAGEDYHNSMWPTRDSYCRYSHNLLNTMLDTGATLQSSLHDVIAKVTLEIAS